MNDFSVLSQRLENALYVMTGQQRAALARQIAAKIRASNAERIKSNIQPDGSPMERRSQKKQGAIRKRAMFQKLHRIQYLRAQGNADGATVWFTGFADRIARVSQYGLRDRVNRNGLMAQYPKREILGISAQDENDIQELVTQYLDSLI